jgi:hypothetical protein
LPTKPVDGDHLFSKVRKGISYNNNNNRYISFFGNRFLEKQVARDAAADAV